MAYGGGPGGKKPSDYFSYEFEPTSDGKKVLLDKRNGDGDALTKKAHSAGAYQRPPDVVMKMRALAAMIAEEKAKDCGRYSGGHRRQLTEPPIAHNMPRLPLDLLNPPAFSDSGIRVLFEESSKFGAWVMETDEGWLFWARMYTLLWVQAKGEDWILLQSLPELFHYHFGEIVDYGKLCISSPISLVRAFRFVESWFDPVNLVRIRLNIDPKRTFRSVSGNSLGKGELAALYDREKAAINTGEKLKSKFYGFQVYGEEEGEELDEWFSHISIPDFEGSKPGTMKARTEELDVVNKNRRELYIMLLLHFPHEGIEHRELEMLLDGRCWKKNYFSHDMWKAKEFNARVIAGSTWIDDIIEIKEKGPRIQTYYARLDMQGLYISDELLNKTSLDVKYRMAQGLPPPQENKEDTSVSASQRSTERWRSDCVAYHPTYSMITPVDEEPPDAESTFNASFESNVAVVGCRIPRAHVDENDRPMVQTRPGMASIGATQLQPQPRSPMTSNGMGRGFVVGNRPSGFGQGNLVIGRKLGPRPG